MSISSTLSRQIVRNMLIDYLDLSLDEIASLGTFGIINLWEDIVPDSWDPEFFTEPVFSLDEQTSIKRFCEIWEQTSDATEYDTFEVTHLRSQKHWAVFVREAQAARAQLSRRVKFSNEIEEF